MKTTLLLLFVCLIAISQAFPSNREDWNVFWRDPYGFKGPSIYADNKGTPKFENDDGSHFYFLFNYF